MNDCSYFLTEKESKHCKGFLIKKKLTFKSEHFLTVKWEHFWIMSEILYLNPKEESIFKSWVRAYVSFDWEFISESQVRTFWISNENLFCISSENWFLNPKWEPFLNLEWETLLNLEWEFIFESQKGTFLNLEWEPF